ESTNAAGMARTSRSFPCARSDCGSDCVAPAAHRLLTRGRRWLRSPAVARRAEARAAEALSAEALSTEALSTEARATEALATESARTWHRRPTEVAAPRPRARPERSGSESLPGKVAARLQCLQPHAHHRRHLLEAPRLCTELASELAPRTRLPFELPATRRAGRSLPQAFIQPGLELLQAPFEVLQPPEQLGAAG